jgi:hypothetical protein
MDAMCSKDAAKELWNGVLNGGGTRHVREWEDQHGKAPALLARVMAEVRRVIEVVQTPELVEKVKDHNGADDVSLTVHTLLFQAYERGICDRVKAAVGGRAAHMGFECDGDVFYTTGSLDVLALAKAAHEHLALKPYMSQADLVAALAKRHAFDWISVEPGWRRRTAAKLELIGRLVNGESGMDMLLKPLVPHRVLRIAGGEYLLRDIYKAAPGGRELDVLAFNVGLGRWELVPSLVACEKLADECASTVIDLLQSRRIEEVPAWIRKGAAMRAAAAGVVRSELYDKAHYMSLDNPGTLVHWGVSLISQRQRCQDGKVHESYTFAPLHYCTFALLGPAGARMERCTNRTPLHLCTFALLRSWASTPSPPKTRSKSRALPVP